MLDLHSLGMQTGATLRPTTFKDDGLNLADAPFAQEWRYAEPVVLGHAAALLRFLRDPYFVRAIKERDGRFTLRDFMFERIAVHLATIYGDIETAVHAHRLLEEQQARTFKGDNHPEWFCAATNGNKDFRLGNAKFKKATALTTIVAVARAHEITGLLNPRAQMQTGAYCQNAASALGWLYTAPLWLPSTTMNINRLYQAGGNHGGVALMDHSLLEEAGVFDMLAVFLASEMLPGTPFSTYLPQISGLMWPEDREALGIEWSDNVSDAFEIWAAGYQARARNDIFSVARQGR